MAQNISMQSNQGYGAIKRVGRTQDGRIVYQATEPNGKVAGHISIAQKDCDLFEKSYRDIMESAPKIQKYAQTTSPDKMAKNQKKAKWIVGLSTAIGGGLPLFLIKGKPGFWHGLLQAAATLGGCIAGLGIGSVVAQRVALPPGASKFAQATKNLSKIDVRPV